MLDQVHPLELVLSPHSKDGAILERAEQDDGPEERPGGDGETSSQVVGEYEPGVAGVSVPEYSSLASREPDVHEPGHAKQTHNAASAMDGNGVKRVVQPEFQHGEVDGHEAESTQSADNESGPGLEEVTAGTESHHAGQGSVESHQETPGLLQGELVHEEDGHSPCGGSQDGVDDG